MDIRMYNSMGYNRKSDEFVKKALSEVRSEIDKEYVRQYIYTDDQRKLLDNLDVFATQMINQRFTFFCGDEEILLGEVKSFKWNSSKTVIWINLKLDKEPDADIEYSANVNSMLFSHEKAVIITDEGDYNPFGENIPENSLKVTL